MKKAFAAALSAALVGGLALAALSGGATLRTSSAMLDDGVASVAARATTITYKGKFRNAGPGTAIKIRARGQGGEPTAIKSMTYRKLPATCPESDSSTIDGGWTFTGVRVNDRRKFKVVGNDGRPNPSSLKFTGRFSRNFNRVKGKFQTTSYFPDDGPGLPAETCVSETERYRAKR